MCRCCHPHRPDPVMVEGPFEEARRTGTLRFTGSVFVRRLAGRDVVLEPPSLATPEGALIVGSSDPSLEPGARSETHIRLTRPSCVARCRHLYAARTTIRTSSLPTTGTVPARVTRGPPSPSQSKSRNDSREPPYGGTRSPTEMRSVSARTLCQARPFAGCSRQRRRWLKRFGTEPETKPGDALAANRPAGPSPRPDGPKL
jgi:hypothetical protein